MSVKNEKGYATPSNVNTKKHRGVLSRIIQKKRQKVIKKYVNYKKILVEIALKRLKN